MKRTERHHIKEDELVVGMNKFLEVFKAWRKEILIGAGILVAAGLIFGFARVIRGAQVRRESRRAAEVLELRAGLEKSPQDVAKLEALARSGKFSRVASISLATYWIEKGQPDKAKAALTGVPASPRDFFYYQARDLTAQVDILLGAYDEAIKILKEIEEAKPKDYLLDAILYRHAEALEKKGSLAEALDLYRKVQTEYSQSYYGYDASLKVRRLEAAK